LALRPFSDTLSSVDKANIRVGAVAGLESGASPVAWDPNEYSGRVCCFCARPRVFRRSRINHSLHFMLALGTVGIWLLFWGMIILFQFVRPWNCTVCGSRQWRN